MHAMRAHVQEEQGTGASYETWRVAGILHFLQEDVKKKGSTGTCSKLLFPYANKLCLGPRFVKVIKASKHEQQFHAIIGGLCSRSTTSLCGLARGSSSKV